MKRPPIADQQIFDDAIIDASELLQGSPFVADVPKVPKNAALTGQVRKETTLSQFVAGLKGEKHKMREDVSSPQERWYV